MMILPDGRESERYFMVEGLDGSRNMIVFLPSMGIFTAYLDLKAQRYVEVF